MESSPEIKTEFVSCYLYKGDKDWLNAHGYKVATKIRHLVHEFIEQEQSKEGIKNG